jgi:hypothetical protein
VQAPAGRATFIGPLDALYIAYVGATAMPITSKKRLLRAVIIGAAIFAVWFALSVLTFNEDTRIDNTATGPY